MHESLPTLSITHLHKRHELDVLPTLFWRKASKAKAGKSATRHITGWKNCQYIHAKRQLFRANNLLGLQIVFAYKIFMIENCRQIRKIIHFECFFLHITVEVTSHSFTVTPRRALQTQHLTGSCKLQHITFQPPSPREHARIICVNLY